MRKFALPILLGSLLLIGAGCFGGDAPVLNTYSLEYWRTDDPSSAFDEIITEYRKVYPNVEVHLTTFRADVYEQELLEALAEDRGPDLFSIPNVWMTAWKNKIQPMPEEVVLPARVVNEQKQVVTVNQKNTMLTVRQLIEQYVEAIPDDVVMLAPTSDPKIQPKNAIYGLPLSFDTLAMFVNNDLLKKAGIEAPAKTWRDFQDQVRSLTVLNGDGTIAQAGAAIGVAQNVRHSADLISVLMMQNGAEMTDASGYARFDRFTPETANNPLTPGASALIFYQSFGRKGASTYTYDTTMQDSLDAFVGGAAAYYFGYPQDANVIRDRAPRLDFSVAALPQVDTADKANIAHYPVEVVSAASPQRGIAWHFLQFAARADNVDSFLNATNRPTALRSVIASQLTNPLIEPFANQVLTGRSWYRGMDWTKAEQAIETMIETYPTVRRPDYQPIVADAANAVNASLR
jgi:multiple sugar transport system substrate-binding protein